MTSIGIGLLMADAILVGLFFAFDTQLPSLPPWFENTVLVGMVSFILGGGVSCLIGGIVSRKRRDQ